MGLAGNVKFLSNSKPPPVLLRRIAFLRIRIAGIGFENNGIGLASTGHSRSIGRSVCDLLLNRSINRDVVFLLPSRKRSPVRCDTKLGAVSLGLCKFIAERFSILSDDWSIDHLVLPCTFRVARPT